MQAWPPRFGGSAAIVPGGDAVIPPCRTQATVPAGGRILLRLIRAHDGFGRRFHGGLSRLVVTHRSSRIGRHEGREPAAANRHRGPPRRDPGAIRNRCISAARQVSFSPARESRMPIPVICPGCKASFRVSDKFAGKTGPCPKCKTTIKIPEAVPQTEQVVIKGAKSLPGRARTPKDAPPPSRSPAACGS